MTIASNGLTAAGTRTTFRHIRLLIWELLQQGPAMWSASDGLQAASLQPIEGLLCKRAERFIGERIHRVHIDFAKHVRVLACRGPRAVEKVRIPDYRE